MSSGYDGVNTPSSSECEKPIDAEFTPAVPCSGKTYKIHLGDTKKVITVTEGEVMLQSPAESRPGGGWYWVCVENGNWLGFRNHVSGNFLGHNGKTHGFQAKVTHHQALEFFCVRPHPRGDFMLLVKYPWGDEMRQVSCAPDGKTVVEKDKDGAQWVFEQV
ncbi:hypothetical protein Daus18300_001771 [Diaporthe australafricana]|uniref:Uncharacterized protein n=1 Tax=Diaporthe australafricana TaxID=127596 RepID=A0ABR3XUG4_9PEZI